VARAIVMPSLGMYTVEGTLAQWLRPQGARVEAGEVVATIETEKANFEIEVADGGILHRVAEIGTVLPLQALIGYVLAEGEAAPSVSAEPDSDAPASVTKFPAAGLPGEQRSGVRASPIAKRLAAEHGIDLARVSGSGPGGRIVEADVLAAVAAAGAVDSPRLPWKVRERVPLKGARRAIADRLRHTLATAASLTITREVRAGGVTEARARFGKKYGMEVPYDALFVKMFAAALRELPTFNAIIEQDTILVIDEVHVGFAVALPGGLIVPVVHHADARPLVEVASAIRELSTRALNGTLRPDDVAGGTASISNLGSYGVDAFTPILNPPQSAILGIGRIVERAVVDGGKVAPAASCVLSLTFDHRVADGAPAAQLLDAVAQRMTDGRYLDGLSE